MSFNVRKVVESSQVPVKIVDSIMGTGKTTGIFKMMDKEHSETKKKFFYVSLFNSEVGDGNEKVEGRIHRDLPHMNFAMPKNVGEGKKENIKQLMRKGRNISTTHTSFKSFDKEAIQLMIDGGYTLVIDEALDCISPYDGWKREDLEVFIESGWIEVEDDGKLVWLKDNVAINSKFEDLMKLCHTESLYIYGDKVIIWEYPPLLLKSLADVYVITYLFEGSIMCSWMKKNNIDYKYLPTNVLDLRPEEEVKKLIKDNLEILKSNKLTELRDEAKGNENQFSVGWYKRNCISDVTRGADKKPLPPTEMMARVTKIMESCVNRTKANSRSTFWTTFKDYKNGLAGKGFKQKPKEGLDPFLPCNTKATNEYRDHTLCMYAVNVFKTTVEVNYLASRGITFDTNQYSLSEMLQFIFRGSLRQGQPMKLLVLSERMEKLLLEWLDE